MEQAKENNKFSRGTWDKSGSTFMQRILLRNARREFVGYSKKMSMHERNDKDALLTNWILRMYRDGYLDPNNTSKDAIDYIEYSQNTQPTPTLIFRLYYTYPEWNPAFLSNKRLVNFINRFYDMIEKKISVDKIYEALYIRSHSREKDPLDLNNHRFSNERHLSTFCAKLMSEGKREKGEIENFFHLYKAKYLDK